MSAPSPADDSKTAPRPGRFAATPLAEIGYSCRTMIDTASDRELPFLGDRYAVEELLGGGSTGMVYRARDRQLERTVAIKVLRSLDPREAARFQRESRAQAAIDHEHICRIFDVGEAGGRAFIAMQFVDGKTLRVLAPGLTLDEKVEILEQTARAVQAAHAGGVIHRDLKPGNIMVERTPGGGVHATVLDFGIAGNDWLPGDDEAVFSSGSPAFMAPEQLLRETADQRVDVYGLGATMYGVLAEQAPFFGETRAEVEDKILAEEPVRLGLVVPGTPDDLETIVTVAMAKRPERRYPTVRAFADDLGRWRRGEPIRARTSGPVYRTATWLRARRAPAAVLAMVVVTTTAAVSTVLWSRHRAEQRRVLAEWHHTEVERADRLLRRARMMPLHDTTTAESAVRKRLAEVEAGLLEYGPLARGPAYYALGFGHLMLRDLEQAEEWLQAAVDVGFSDPEVESALGIAQALQVLEPGPGGDVARDDPRVREAIRHLGASGARTSERDELHRAFALFLAGELDGAIEAAQASSDQTPWLYEALQLEGDILVARAGERRGRGDLEGAREDLVSAGSAYARGLEVARSDAWLYAAEARRLLRLMELAETAGGEPTGSLAERARVAAAHAVQARPSPETSALAARVRGRIPESHGANGG
jgi:serine/threonine-protein kinase